MNGLSLFANVGIAETYLKQDGVVNKTFVQMMETLGYDIELTYVKRED